jgi:uncharacterized protein
MKLHLTTSESQHLITSYDGDFVAINQQRYERSLIVTPDQLIQDWYTGNFNSLTADALSPLVTLSPEVVLFGTGHSHHFLHPRIYEQLTAKGIPIEFMSTAAACRTYNILMSEGRNVAAALLLE